MQKKRVVSLVLALALSTSLITGCGNDTKTDTAEETKSIVANEEPIVEDYKTNRVDSFEKTPDIKVFNPGEHVYMIRYNLLEELGCSIPEDINSASISVPEGYEILDIENFSGFGIKIGTTQTYGVDVWYINTETVEVKPVYNKAFNSYDYSSPGKVVKTIVEQAEEYTKTK